MAKEFRSRVHKQLEDRIANLTALRNFVEKENKNREVKLHDRVRIIRMKLEMKREI